MCVGEGDWGHGWDLAPPAFNSLTFLKLSGQAADESFDERAPLPELFPALERLEWTGGCYPCIQCDVPGLSRLTHLELTDSDLDRTHILFWGGMHRLGRLQELKIHLPTVEVPELARLPPSVTMLDVAVCRWGESDNQLWDLDHAEEEPLEFDACQVLDAIKSGPHVRKLTIDAPVAARFSHAAFARLLAGGPLASLQELELRRPKVQLHVVSALAMQSPACGASPSARWTAGLG